MKHCYTGFAPRDHENQEEDISMSKLPESNEDTSVESGHGSTPSTPRWVKVFGIIALILVMLFIILHLTGNNFGGHGGHTAPSSVIEQGVK
jgi:hypothetical protein